MPEAARAAAQPTLGAALRQATARPAARRHRPGRRRCAPAAGRGARAVGGPGPEPAGAAARARSRSSGSTAALPGASHREPVSRILGEREFYGRSFAISPATLDPRPDSETLIEAALERAGREGWLAAPLRILDVGTGSGCLLLTLLCELPNAVGVGTDISEAALDVARDNARRLGVEHRAQWLHSDALEAIGGAFRYIGFQSALRALPTTSRGSNPRFAAFDPWSALDGGDDGLTSFAALLPEFRAQFQMVGSCWRWVMIRPTPLPRLLELRSLSGIKAGDIEFYRDVTGKRRCVAARTRN